MDKLTTEELDKYHKDSAYYDEHDGAFVMSSDDIEEEDEPKHIIRKRKSNGHNRRTD